MASESFLLKMRLPMLGNSHVRRYLSLLTSREPIQMKKHAAPRLERSLKFLIRGI